MRTEGTRRGGGTRMDPEFTISGRNRVGSWQGFDCLKWACGDFLIFISLQPSSLSAELFLVGCLGLRRILEAGLLPFRSVVQLVLQKW